MTILVRPHEVGVEVIPLKVTWLEPWVEPKFKPLMVTEVPAAPDVGEILLIVGATVNATPLLAKLATVTTTGPVVAPDGTGTAMLVFAQLVGEAVVPLNVTVLLPWELPKVNPLIVIDVPGAASVVERLVMLGATLKFAPLLSTPLV